MLGALRTGNAPLQGKKVLVIDDDIRNVFALTSTLEQRGMKVVFAENGREGIDRLLQHANTDLVLLDIMMPEMDGYETARAIRSMPRFEHLPIISLTAKAMKGDREKAIAAGASDYITKPVDIDQLVAMMRVWLDARATAGRGDRSRAWADGRSDRGRRAADPARRRPPGEPRALEACWRRSATRCAWRASGHEALRLLLEHDVALILLDVRMPELDGLETARLIKGRARTRDVPIVFLTAARDDIGASSAATEWAPSTTCSSRSTPSCCAPRWPCSPSSKQSRRALKRSETFLRAAFEAAPIGKTMLDGDARDRPLQPRVRAARRPRAGGARRRADPELCHPEDRACVSDAFDRVAEGDGGRTPSPMRRLDLRVVTRAAPRFGSGWSHRRSSRAICPTPLLLAQWVDLSSRRRAEEARAELLMEHAARTPRRGDGRAPVEAPGAERCDRFAVVAPGARRAGGRAWQSCSMPRPPRSRSPATRASPSPSAPSMERPAAGPGQAAGGARAVREVPIVIEGRRPGPSHAPSGRPFVHLRRAVADAGRRRARRARDPPRPTARARASGGSRAAARPVAQAASRRSPAWNWPRTTKPPEPKSAATGTTRSRCREAGWEWCWGTSRARGVPAASAMGQLRSVTRAFALADDGFLTPAEMLTRLNRHQLALGQTELFTVVYAIIDPARGHDLVGLRGSSAAARANPEGWTTYLEGGDGLMGIEDIVLSGSPGAA